MRVWVFLCCEVGFGCSKGTALMTTSPGVVKCFSLTVSKMLVYNQNSVLTEV